ncbi:MAG: hypothetical protein L0332_32410 [Chloroflexi bacterium]|nr:hypothetical protein [Chloroflexota bacterium]MCI0576901.1 hypothetical protein [Chloroflexota bacterium]MCI0646445.1 hypothetical protein [Chloroflexota bacterium]MCI0731407.1 hypothetical protein [Chloroflexota bacterium]
MLLIEHRVNTVEKLLSVPTDRGIEVDVRDYDGELRLVHDPFLSGERLEELLGAYRHALVIFNVKCDGLEERIMALAAEYRVENYFFLDVAPPTLIRLARRGVRQAAVRYSEYEPIEAALALAGRVEWVWVDCFNRLPLDPASYEQLRRHFKLCLVSPELQKFPREMIQSFRRQLWEMPVDAVCTDFCEDWVSESES